MTPGKRKEESIDIEEIAGGLKELRRAVDDLSRRIGEMERTVSSIAERSDPDARTGEGACCSDDLIGCLDDCVDDVKELRKRVRDARSPERGH